MVHFFKRLLKSPLDERINRLKGNTKLMKPVQIIILFFISFNVNAQIIDYKHDWDEKHYDDYIQYTSKKEAPIPFSTTGEPQAVMNIGVSLIEEKSLDEIVDEELIDRRKEYSIAEYLETDHKPDNNIVRYKKTIHGTNVIVVKYRISGFKDGASFMTRSVKQIFFVKNQKLWVSTLIVLFAEDQDNLRSDQITCVKEIINSLE